MDSRRFAGLSAAAASLLAIAPLVGMALAVDLQVGRLFDLPSLVDAGPRAARLLELSMWVDAAFYAALLPVVLGLLPRGSLLLTLRAGGGGLVYAIAGGFGAVVLARGWPPLMLAFAEAGAEQQAVLASSFAEITDVIVRWLWNVTCACAGGVWWLAIADATRGRDRRLSRVSMALATASLLSAGAHAGRVDALTGPTLAAVLVLLPVWCACAALHLLRPRAS